MKHRFSREIVCICIIQVAFFALFYPFRAKGQNPANISLAVINKNIEALNTWQHFGWQSRPYEHSLRFQDNSSMLVFGKKTMDYKPFSYRNESGWSYSQAYIEKLDGRLEKPVQPAFIITGFAIPVDKIDYKNLKFYAKTVISSEEDKQLDWPYPNPPVIKVEINSLQQEKSFSVAKRYKPIYGFDDSTVVERVNKIDFYYPLYIRYHQEPDGNPDKRYIAEAMKMLKELFVNLELYSKVIPDSNK